MRRDIDVVGTGKIVGVGLQRSSWPSQRRIRGAEAPCASLKRLEASERASPPMKLVDAR
jgi:hypothetical protein